MARKPATAPVLKLEGDLDVFSVQAQWERLQPLLLHEGGQVHLDLGALGDIDLSGIQLLFALNRELHTRHIGLEVTGVRDEWAARFAPLGLASVFSGGAS